MKLTVFAMMVLSTVSLPAVSSFRIVITCDKCMKLAGAVLTLIENGEKTIKALNSSCTRKAPVLLAPMCRVVFNAAEKLREKAKGITPEQACVKLGVCELTMTSESEDDLWWTSNDQSSTEAESKSTTKMGPVPTTTVEPKSSITNTEESKSATKKELATTTTEESKSATKIGPGTTTTVESESTRKMGPATTTTVESGSASKIGPAIASTEGWKGGNEIGTAALTKSGSTSTNKIGPAMILVAYKLIYVYVL